jgi:hypothetical protein
MLDDITKIPIIKANISIRTLIKIKTKKNNST